MSHAGKIRRTLLLLPLTAAGLAGAGCYEGTEAAPGPLADARVPLELTHQELFGDAVPPPPDVEVASEDLREPEPDPEAIYGGTTTNVCGWPSTVELGGACSGTLVHPQVVVYAAHCGTSYSKIYFGENYQSPGKTVTPSSCKVYPGTGPGGGDDWAVCKL